MNKKTLLILMALIPQFLTANCWDIRETAEINGFSALENNVIFSVKDAETCAPVRGIKLQMNGKEYAGDGRGYVVLSGEDTGDFFDEAVSVKFAAEKYIDLELFVPFTFGDPKFTKFLMSKEIPAESARFVLQWDKQPRDLDLHLKSPNFHVSYRNQRALSGKAKLDRDDTNGYGPETITLDKIEAQKTYRVFVDNYSNEVPFDGNGQVQIYINNRQADNVTIPPGSGKKYEIGKIVNKKFIPNR